MLWCSKNQLTGGLEPLRGFTQLSELFLESNLLTGGLEPLRGCTDLQWLEFENNQLVPSDEDKAHFEKQCAAEGSEIGDNLVSSASHSGSEEEDSASDSEEDVGV